MAPRSRIEGNVKAFPALQKIPQPELPLSGLAYDKYMELAKGLLNSRKLNAFTRMQCEHFAIGHAAMSQRIAQGLTPSRASMDAQDRLMRELQLVDEGDAIAAPPVGQENRFSRIGVIVRPGTEKAELRPS